MLSRPLRQLAPTIALLAAADAAKLLTSQRHARVAVPAAAVAALALGRRHGATWSDLGLDRSTWGAGAAYGAGSAVLVGGAVAAAATLPATRSLFLDTRFAQEPAAALRYALLGIPLLTVAPEEIAFRGVLLEAFSRYYGPSVSAVASSLLFGLWHIPLSLDYGTENLGLAERAASTGRARVMGVLATVLGTAAADVIFVQLRRRSGSLLAPAGLHWAFNGAGVLASAVLWRRVAP